MGRIIRICELALLAGCTGVPSTTFAKTADPANSYATARIAEIGNRESEALKIYMKLYRDAPDSAVLADRIFASAIRSGDVTAALRAVRAQELRGQVSGEAILLLFADAFSQKNWPMAMLAADELTARSNLGFVAPILRGWVNVAQNKPHDLPVSDPQTDALYAFYARDQRAYFEMNAGEYAKAKQSLRELALSGGEYSRDVLLRAVPIMRAQGDDMFADSLLYSAMPADRSAIAALPKPEKQQAKLTPEEGLAALHVRIAAALLEQKILEPALVLARIAVGYAPGSPSAKLVLAKALVLHGLVDGADDILQTIPQTSPYWALAVRDRVAQMKPEAAVALSRDAAQRWPQSPSLALQAAQAQENAGNLKEAASSYRSVADQADTGGVAARQRANYRLLLASALDNSGNWNGARKELEAALVLDPNNAQILNYLGYAMLERSEDVPRATAFIEKAFQGAPDSVAITDSMGWAYFIKGDYQRAVTLLEKAAKASGNDSTINEHLGDAYWQTGRMRDARYAWRVAAEGADGDAVSRIGRKIDLGLVQAVAKR